MILRKQEGILSPKQPLIPPYGFSLAWFEERKVVVRCVDDDVAFHARHDTGYDEYGTAPFGVPAMSECPGNLTVEQFPACQRPRIRNLALNPGGNGDVDPVLIGRRRPTPLDQFFQHCCRVMLGGVYHPVSGFMPAARDSAGAFGAIHWPGAFRVADPVCCKRLYKPVYMAHTTTPATARRTRFSTAWAPAELDRAISNGVAPSSSGWGRYRKPSMRIASPWYAWAKASMTRPSS